MVILTENIEFGVRIAGEQFLIRTKSKSVRAFFRDFVSVPDSSELRALEASDEEIDRAEKKYRETQMRERAPVPDRIGRSFLELTVIHEKMTLALLPQDIFLMHGSALCMDDRAYIFTAPSGTGKSTHARLWREIYGDRVRMINDDKPYIRFDSVNRTFTVCSSPWRGKHGLGTDTEALLGGICILHRAEENNIRLLNAEEVLPGLMSQFYRPSGREDMIRTLSFAGSLSEHIPVYALFCNMDPEAARLSCRVLIGDGNLLRTSLADGYV